MNDAPDTAASRRDALRLMGRGLLGAALAAVAGLSAGRRAGGPAGAAGCAGPSACAGCAALRGCTLPPARSFRTSETGRDVVSEVRHGG